jgi:hypothetical protein
MEAQKRIESLCSFHIEKAYEGKSLGVKDGST